MTSLEPGDREEGEKESQPKKNADEDALYYEVDDVPSVPLLFLCALQIAVTNVFSCLTFAVLIGDLICADKQFTTSLYTTSAVMAGVSTILQTLLGLRLPVFQGPSAMFIVPYLVAKDDPSWGCGALQYNTSGSANITVTEGPWMDNWRKTQGSLMLASLFHVSVGMFGLGGLLLRVIGPLTITTMITLLGLAICRMVSAVAEPCWPLATFSAVVAIVCCRYINHVRVPIPIWRPKHGWSITRYPLFQLFPVMLSVLVTWFLSFILTVSGAFTENPSYLEYQARTDISLDLIYNATVFNFPYPGQYGKLDLSPALLLTFVICSLGSMLESIGDYIQTANSCQVPSPPSHAINRGILMEGIGSVLSGLFGAGHATTSFSNIIGIISATKVASRSVMVLGGVIVILMALLGHVTAVLVTIPKPALAGGAFLGVSLLIASALSNLSQVDLSIQRNVTVLGMGLLAGTTIPAWLRRYPNAINTGVGQVDMLLYTILAIPLIVGGIVACFLDATLPGESSATTRAAINKSPDPHKLMVYETRCMRWLVRRLPILGKLPVLPAARNTNVRTQCNTTNADTELSDFNNALTV